MNPSQSQEPSLIRMRYSPDGVTFQDLTFTAGREPELFDRCAAAFCAQLTPEDRVRYAEIIKRFPPPRKG